MSTPSRSRDQDGTFREKRGDTRVEHLKTTYPEFRNVNGNTKLGTLKERLGVDSLDGVRRALRKY
jgi:hypothetical protein